MKSSGLFLFSGGKRVLAAAALVVFYVQTGAAQVAPESLLKKETAYTFEPIKVTARKHEENLGDVPAGINVFTDVMIEDAGIKDLRAITQQTPNVSMRNNGAENFVQIRGVSIPHTSLSGPTPVYVDDVVMPNPYMGNPELFDIQRVEVLKGPQGTLYGRNSEAGVIHIITRQPDNEFYGKVTGTLAGDDTRSVSGGISGPMVKDKLFYGISAQKSDAGGHVENRYNGNDRAGETDGFHLRPVLRWVPTDRLDITLKYDLMEGSGGYGFYRYTGGPYATGRHEINWDGKNYWDQEGRYQSVRIKYRGDHMDFLSVTGRNTEESKFGNDYDFTSDPMNNWGSLMVDYEGELLSQEVRLSSRETGGILKWLVGASAFKEEIDYLVDFDRLGMKRSTCMEKEGGALFGQAVLTLARDYHLTLGLRYDRQNFSGTQHFTSMAGPAVYQGDPSFSELLPKVSIAYDITPGAMVYGTISKGYLTGGFNYAMVASQDEFIYDSEQTWNHELGVKLTALDNRLKLNLALFYIDMQDKQVMEWPAGGGPRDRKISNAAKAHSKGVELDIAYRPAPGLDFFAGFGFTHARFDQWQAREMGGAIYDYSGKTLPHVPACTYSAGVQYRHGSGFFSRIDFMGSSDFYTDAKNGLETGSHILVNTRLGYEGDNFDIILWAKNLLDDAYAANEWDMGGGNTLIQDGAPRAVGITARVRF